MEELKDYSPEEIASFIEGVEIGEVPVHPKVQRAEAVIGMSTENAVPGEGTVTYDIRFYVLVPGKGRIKLILNIEIQKKFYPGYDLVTRAVFYCARMISAQLGTEFGSSNYDDIKKVYSIWLCLNSPEKEADTIVEYRMEPKVLYGKAEAGHRYDLLSVVMVGLDGKSSERKTTSLHGFLGTVFSENLKPAEKLKRLEEDYGIEPTREIKEGVNRMCNLSDAVEERGIQKGIQQGEEQKLIELICRKVRKEKSLPVIAEELEEEESAVLRIYNAVLESAPDYDSSRVYMLLHGE